MIGEMHLVPDLIVSIVEDMNKSKESHALVYEKRLEVIRDFINLSLRKRQDNLKAREVFRKKNDKSIY